MVERSHPVLQPVLVRDCHRDQADVEQQQEGVQGLRIHLITAVSQAGRQVYECRQEVE
jgi:hypothetical protein